ncbi:MAG: hypothetical protein E7649_06555 [Ruminococcaceae bacterium]|nr:hypothetical protein [Oscillospiraceae bacterium]
MESKSYVIVTDHVQANTGRDLSDELQRLILDNPNRTIFFPDGEYVLSKPISTPANPEHSVSLMLSTYAILKASDDWSSKEAMVRMGAAEPFNSIDIVGSNYSFKGGVIDGNGIANGISIDSGRETLIREVSIKNTKIGLHIKYGANYGSSDCDIEGVNIVGNGKADSIGVLCEGWDNTFTNMRISSVHIGVKVTSAGNSFRNVHPLYIFTPELEAAYDDSYAFCESGGRNWYSMCYSDQFATGFKITDSEKSTYSDCFAFWYSPKGNKQIGFESRGKFESIIRSCSISFHPESAPQYNAYIKVGETGGKGIIDTPLANDDAMLDKSYKDYVKGEVL